MKKFFFYILILTSLVIFILLLDFLSSNFLLNKKNCFLFEKYFYSLEKNCSGTYRFKSSFPSNRIFTDEKGLRVRKNYKKLNIETNKDIFVFGDSFTFGVGLDYKDTYIGLLEENFKEYNFLNFAVPSYSPSVYLHKLNEMINNGINPEKILVFLDLSDVFDEATRWKFDSRVMEAKLLNDDIYKKNQKVDFKEKNFKILKQFSSIINTELRYIRNKQKIKKRIKTSVQGNFTYKNLDNLNTGFWNREKFEFGIIQIKTIFSEIQKISSQKKIELYLIIYPWVETLEYGQENFNWSDFSSEICTKNCKIIDTIPYFIDYKKKNINWMFDLYFPNDEHFNASGNQFLFEILKKNIF